MTQTFAIFSLICHFIVIAPFLFNNLSEIYPPWSISLTFLLGLLVSITSLISLVIDRYRRKPIKKITFTLVILTLALSLFEIGAIIVVLRTIGQFD